ncbi:MAG: hypothetical protein Kow00108_13290 [Calditrichia bacterium]
MNRYPKLLLLFIFIVNLIIFGLLLNIIDSQNRRCQSENRTILELINKHITQKALDIDSFEYLEFSDIISLYKKLRLILIIEDNKIVYEYNPDQVDLNLINSKVNETELFEDDHLVVMANQIGDGKNVRIVTGITGVQVSDFFYFFILIVFFSSIVFSFLIYNYLINKKMYDYLSKIAAERELKLSPLPLLQQFTKFRIEPLVSLLNTISDTIETISNKTSNLSKILEKISFPVFVTDKNYHIKFANSAFYSLYDLNNHSEQINMNSVFGNSFSEIIKKLQHQHQIMNHIVKLEKNNEINYISISVQKYSQRDEEFLVFTAKEVTELISSQKELMEDKKRLEAINKAFSQKTLLLEQEKLKNERNSKHRFFLLETMSELARIDDMQEMANYLLVKIHEYFELSAAGIYFIKSKDDFHIQSNFNFENVSIQLSDHISGDSKIISEIFNQRYPVLINEDNIDNYSSELGLKIDEPNIEGLVIPVLEQKKQLGILILFKKRDHLFVMDEINVLDAMAKHISIFLLNRILIHELNIRNDDLERALDELKNSQKQILQLQKMESLGRLVGGIAHDFNNILGIILPTSELLYLSNNLNEEDKEKLEMIRNAATRGSDLTRQLLIFSREQKSVRFPFELNNFIKINLNLFSKFLLEHIRLIYKPADHEVWIEGDKNQIFQVISNLIINSIDAILESNRENGLIEIGTFGHLDKDYERYTKKSKIKGNIVGFYLKDNGAGIPEEMQTRIFDPFFTTKDVGKGTGLGLSIVFAIITNQHGGEIYVESEPGKGTNFIFLLPEPREKEEPAEQFKGDFLPKGSECIMIVDDEEFIRLSLKFLLEKLGYKVVLFGSGVEAVNKFKELPNIDLAIVDYAMPIMNGIATIEKLKSMKKDLKIILSTGYLEEISEKKRNALVDDICLKPFDIYEMSSIIRRVLDRKNIKFGDYNGKN